LSNLDLLQSLKLSNGLILSICDHTRAYFGDYHLVKLEINFSLDDTVGDRILPGTDCSDIRRLSYNCCLERMGVHSSDLESVKNILLNDFEASTLPYISAAQFPQRLAARELAAKKAPVRKFLGAAA